MNVTQNLSLVEWNQMLRMNLLPSTVILIVYMLTGLIGNVLVIYMYIWHLRSHSVNRQFIPILALVDLAVCMVAVPFSLSINMLPVMFSEEYLCNSLHFMSTFLVLFSMDMLVLIAFQRYKMICKPLNRQLRRQEKISAFVLMVLIDLLLATSAFALYGVREVKHTSGIVGYMCTNLQKTEFLHIFCRLLVISKFVFLFVSVIIFYSLIAMKIKELNKTAHKINLVLQKKRKQIQEYSCKCIGNYDLTSSNQHQQKIARNKVAHRRTENRRFTLLFWLISTVNLIGLFPKLVLVIIEGLNEDFWTSMSPINLSMSRFLYNINYANNVINPLLYGFFDMTFREKLLAIIKLR